jgi:hypothetical protein
MCLSLLYPDPHKNVMDPEHFFFLCYSISISKVSGRYRYRMYQRTCEEVKETVFRWGPFGPEDFKKHLDQLMDFLKAKLPSVEFIWLTNPMGKYKQFFYRNRQMRYLGTWYGTVTVG